MHLEFLLEEPSAEVFLDAFLPRVLPANVTRRLHSFRGKHDLLRKLPERLKAYQRWIPPDWRLVILIDRDSADCVQLKQQMEISARNAGLKTKSARSRCGQFRVVNRIAVEELEAWFLGDFVALRTVYPRVPESISKKPRFRDPDAIPGGTWEALERVLQAAGYFKGGLSKIEVARTIAPYIDPLRNRSKSFQCFIEGLHACVS